MNVGGKKGAGAPKLSEQSIHLNDKPFFLVRTQRDNLNTNVMSHHLVNRRTIPFG